MQLQAVWHPLPRSHTTQDSQGENKKRNEILILLEDSHKDLNVPQCRGSFSVPKQCARPSPNRCQILSRYSQSIFACALLTFECTQHEKPTIELSSPWQYLVLLKKMKGISYRIYRHYLQKTSRPSCGSDRAVKRSDTRRRLQRPELLPER